MKQKRSNKQTNKKRTRRTEAIVKGLEIKMFEKFLKNVIFFQTIVIFVLPTKIKNYLYLLY